jgi:hypothetical protein
VVVDDDCKAALDAWIEIRGGQPGPLFTPVLRSRRLTPMAVWVVTRLGAPANNPPVQRADTDSGQRRPWSIPAADHCGGRGRQQKQTDIHGQEPDQRQ